MSEILTILLPIISLVVGSGLTWLITKQTKKQDWIAEVNKQLIQKRLEAYEHIIEATKGIAVVGGSIENNEFIKYHLIVVDSEYYNNWSFKFTIAASRYSHFIDSELSNELTKLNNYLAHLSFYLGHWNTENETKISKKKLKILGQIIYSDISKLTSDILETSGTFYSDSIYNQSYLPSTLNRKEFQIPENFNNLYLFSEEKLIKSLIEENGDIDVI